MLLPIFFFKGADMATNEGHMTKLEAVNEMLLSIGESPVQTLTSGLGDASIAESVLERTSRQVQLKGWHCNTDRGLALAKNADNQFALGVDTLKVDTVNAVSGRQTNRPTGSAFINAGMRRSADDTKWLMYDNDNLTEVWSSETELSVDRVFLLDFAKLTPALQVYVWTQAAHRFQKSLMGSRVLFEFTATDVLDAETQAVQEDSENEDLNIIRESGHVFGVAYRYGNAGFGR